MLTADAGIIAALFFLGLLAIQEILILLNVSAGIGIVLWERERRRSGMLLVGSSKENEWIVLKNHLDSLQKEIKSKRKSNDPGQVRILERRRAWLQNELRRTEWKMREEQFDQLFKSKLGALKRKDEISKLEAEEQKVETFLFSTLDSVREIASREKDPESLRLALLPTLNSLKAHYNILKRRGAGRSSLVLRDVWVVWAVVASVAEGISPQDDFLKYPSEPIKKAISKLLKDLKSHELQRLKT
jgi:hypothetical protein